MGDTNWSVFVLGLSFTIPLSILANLLTPHVTQWLQVRSIYTRGENLNRLREDLDRITMLYNNPGTLNQRFMVVTLSTVFCSIILFLELILLGISNLAFSIIQDPLSSPQLLGPDAVIMRLVLVGALMLLTPLAFIVALITANTVSQLAGDILRVRQFMEYRNQTLLRIKRLEEKNAQS